MSGTRPSTAVVLAADEGYELPAASLIGSLADTSAASLEQVILLDCGLSESTTADMTHLAIELGIPFEVRDVTRELRQRGDLPIGRHLTKATWARLLVPLICQDVDRCLYLDADTLCLDDIGPLLATDLEGCIVGAVQDVFHPTLGGPICLPGLDLDRARRQAPYFNAGVLLIDVAEWRATDITTQAFEFVRRHPESIRFWDQDALNAVLIGRWHKLERIWNMPPVRNVLDTLGFGYFGGKLLKAADFLRLETDARIVHYLTELKPWLPGFPEGAQLDRYRTAVDRIAPLWGGNRL